MRTQVSSAAQAPLSTGAGRYKAVVDCVVQRVFQAVAEAPAPGDRVELHRLTDQAGLPGEHLADHPEAPGKIIPDKAKVSRWHRRPFRCRERF